MSELIVVDYHDALRAGQVLYTLRHLRPEWSVDLEHAAALVRRGDGTVQLQQKAAGSESSAGEGCPAASLMGALLEALFPPEARSGERAGAAGRQEQVGLAADFMQRLNRLIRPGDSALLMLVNRGHADLVIDELGRYGGRLLHTPFTPQQQRRLSGLQEFRHLTGNRI